jgi:hypothetical protein
MSNKIVESLHEATHRVPGVPAHDDSAKAHGQKAHGQRGVNHHPRLQNSTAHHERTPRVLVGWQNWIAAQLRRKS